MFWASWHSKKKSYYSLRRGIFDRHVPLEADAFGGLIGGLLGLFAFPTVHFFAVPGFIITHRSSGRKETV